MHKISNKYYIIIFGDDTLFTVRTSSSCYNFATPVFEIDGKEASFVLSGHGEKYKSRKSGVYDVLYTGVGIEGLRLRLRIKSFDDSPFIRFQYILSSDKGAIMTKKGGDDNIRYFDIDIDGGAYLEETQLSHFAPHLHTYLPVTRVVPPVERAAQTQVPGPIMTAEYDGAACLIAYEHGATHPDCYLAFSTDESSVAVKAVKGNYYSNQPLGGNNIYESVWFEFGALDGDKKDLLTEYREFILQYLCEYDESRKPYIFYNTWNYQERGHNFLHRGYIEDLHFDRVLLEIDAAHKMGVDVFVIDTSWYTKTGDWSVNTEKFPDKLRLIKEKLDGYGMKLGLWFNPTVAAKTSEIVLSHPEYRMSSNGRMEARPIWETEESYGMCLCSGYWEYFAEKLISMYKELGVCYFKWDGIGQYGCDSPLHEHGGAENSPLERRECYSYMMGLRMIKIVERLQNECPEAIVDFDITEQGRFVGLGFLSAGKYFLCNNGPYARDFDQPEVFRYQQKEPVQMPPYVNVFFYPGAARSRFCRQGLRYDGIIPSILLLTHFLPDAPLTSQMNSIASLVLGGNGIWGDLSSLSDRDIDVFAKNLAQYKKVRDSVTKSYPIVSGEIGTSPEIYEKVDPATGCGVICFFTHKAGTYQYITQSLARQPGTVYGAVKHEFIKNGHLAITVELEEDSACAVFLY